MPLDYLRCPGLPQGDIPVGTEPVFYGSESRPVKYKPSQDFGLVLKGCGPTAAKMPSSGTMNPLDRLKVLINSSTPIVIMETVEEVRTLCLVRAACSDLSLAVFEWTIADGLVRSG